MTVKEVLEKSILFLKNKNSTSPRLDAELLISHLLKLNRMGLYLKYDQPLLPEEIENCRNIIVERGKGTPVAYLTQEKGFYGLDFKVNSSVLVPRPETELLVEEILNYIPNYFKKLENQSASFEFLELGVGSGCISITLAKELLIKPNVSRLLNGELELKIDALDISASAISIAQENADKILQSKAKKINFLNLDAFYFEPQKNYDIIYSNPPYIAENDPNIEKNVKDFEPHLALFAKNNGLDCIIQWFKFGVSNLKPNGMIIFEIGSTQGHDVLTYVQSLNSFHDICIIKDYSGLDRFIKAVKNG